MKLLIKNIYFFGFTNYIKHFVINKENADACREFCVLSVKQAGYPDSETHIFLGAFVII